MSETVCGYLRIINLVHAWSVCVVCSMHSSLLPYQRIKGMESKRAMDSRQLKTGQVSGTVPAGARARVSPVLHNPVDRPAMQEAQCMGWTARMEILKHAGCSKTNVEAFCVGSCTRYTLS